VRILKVSQTYFPFQAEGGRPTKVRALANGLARRGHDVTVLTTDMGFGKPGGPPEPPSRIRWGWRAEEGGVAAIYLRTWARYRALTLNPEILSFCAETLGSFDVVHIYGLYDLIGFPVASRCSRRGIPYVVEPIGMFRPIVRSLWLKRAYHFLGGKRLVQRASRVIATSDKEQEEFISGGIAESNIIVRRNGVEVPERLPEPGSFRRERGIPAKAKLILFLGRLIAKKSPDLLLRAYAKWRQDAGRVMTSVLVLGGPDEGDGYLPKLENLSRELGLGEIVQFTGPLYDQAKWAAYRDADVFVLPSQHENFGNTAAEAVACGAPVIVTDRCGIAPVVNGRAGLVVPYGEAELERALEKILAEESPRDRYQIGCEEVARDLTWKEPITEMEALYSKLTVGSEAR
jgi:glycosyltransferase involved in cell wall biosynthesis